MELKYRVHLDDFHSTVIAHWNNVETCLQEIENEISKGFDVTDATLDGKPLLCTRCRAQGAIVPADQHYAARPGLCITHDHQATYDHYSRLGRYQGD